MKEKELVMMSSGDYPDVAQMVWLKEFARNNLLVDLTDEAKTWDAYPHLTSGQLGRMTYNGRIYGLTLGNNCIIQYYNKGILERVGMTGPLTTLDQVQELAQKIVAAHLTTADGKPIYAVTFDGGNWATDYCLLAAGGLDGADEPAAVTVERHFSAQPYVYDGRPRRDERFQDPYNMGVNAEAFLYDERFAPQPKVLMMFFKRMREIDVPEMMASIIIETPGKPWEYYQEMSRQVWDEARHALMGEVGFISLGLDWRKVAFNFTWSLTLNTELTPLERHGVLYYIERGLMPNTGKRFEWEVGVASQNALVATFQDYDWADEVLHAHIGRSWYVPEFAHLQEALTYGDHAWSRVMSDWQAWRDQGLTQHRNWWPEIYRDACVTWNVEPDLEILAFSETYEEVRADRKVIAASE